MMKGIATPAYMQNKITTYDTQTKRRQITIMLL